MSQNHLQFNGYTPPDPDSDGYQVVFDTTAADSAANTMRGVRKNPVIYTKETYSLKWSNIKAGDASDIIRQVMGRNSFQFFHYNLYTGSWETSDFYVTSINSPFIRLNSGKETISELSFDVQAINPLEVNT